MKWFAIIPAVSLAAAQVTQVATVKVVAGASKRTVTVTGEFHPYQSVAVHARVSGYIERITVDRGSAVRKGQSLAVLSAPEMTAQLAEAQAKLQTAESQKVEAQAKLVALESTHERLKAAAQTPGVIAGNELVLAEKAVSAAQAAVASAENARRAATAAVEAQQDLMRYLNVVAPFDGVITERMMHTGALAGPSTGPIFRLEQLSRLRLVAAVPETEVGGILRGARVTFRVPAFPGQTFHGTVARVGRTIDQKTRTMPVEVDVGNATGRLAPGMYPEIDWPSGRAGKALLVPPSSVAVNTERSFVIRVTGGRAEWKDVRRGRPSGDLVEVYGDLAAGDEIVHRASDEIRDGSPVRTRPSR